MIGPQKPDQDASGLYSMGIPISSAGAFMSEHPTPPELASQSVVVSLPVQWGDQDLFGHVNGVVYFRWFETARVEYLNRSGMKHLMSGEGRGPILASIRCDYRRQLKYPDAILVSASVREIGRSSMKMRHLIYSGSQQAIAAEGESTVVMFDYVNQRPTRVPDEIRQQIERLEGRLGDNTQ
jgi:acyl-CoA thioester hydrolase